MSCCVSWSHKLSQLPSEVSGNFLLLLLLILLLFSSIEYLSSNVEIF